MQTCFGHVQRRDIQGAENRATGQVENRKTSEKHFNCSKYNLLIRFSHVRKKVNQLSALWLYMSGHNRNDPFFKLGGQTLGHATLSLFNEKKKLLEIKH